MFFKKYLFFWNKLFLLLITVWDWSVSWPDTVHDPLILTSALVITALWNLMRTQQQSDPILPTLKLNNLVFMLQKKMVRKHFRNIQYFSFQCQHPFFWKLRSAVWWAATLITFKSPASPQFMMNWLWAVISSLLCSYLPYPSHNHHLQGVSCSQQPQTLPPDMKIQGVSYHALNDKI